LFKNRWTSFQFSNGGGTVGVQREGKIDGGRTSYKRGASGDRLFFLNCAEGKALSTIRRRCQNWPW